MEDAIYSQSIYDHATYSARTKYSLLKNLFTETHISSLYHISLGVNFRPGIIFRREIIWKFQLRIECHWLVSSFTLIVRFFLLFCFSWHPSPVGQNCMKSTRSFHRQKPLSYELESERMSTAERAIEASSAEPASERCKQTSKWRSELPSSLRVDFISFQPIVPSAEDLALWVSLIFGVQRIKS